MSGGPQKYCSELLRGPEPGPGPGGSLGGSGGSPMLGGPMRLCGPFCMGMGGWGGMELMELGPGMGMGPGGPGPGNGPGPMGGGGPQRPCGGGHPPHGSELAQHAAQEQGGGRGGG